MDPAARSKRVVVVTGASSGLGRAASVELARRGDVHLLLVARRVDALEETIALATRAAPAGSVLFDALGCDLSEPAAVERLVADLTRRHGRIHALVNNAGIGGLGDFEEPSGLADLDRMIALNLRAPMALVHGLLPGLEAAGGAIVNVSSVAGMVGTPRSPAYSATKWGLTGFSEAMRGRLARRGVRVVCIQPGPVPTPGWSHERLVRSRWTRRTLATTPEAVARAIARAALDRHGPAAPVLPRTYAPIPLVRGLAPWLLRRLVAAGGGTRGAHPASREADPGMRIP